MLINAGIAEIVIKGDYPDKMSKDLLKEAKVRVRVLR
jgi:deoxycytidylate deaminase